ncbi:MAG TPA: hypothetical protein DCR93_13175 [Cytophagales bacterium]|nr:hypothetical protein [Cytophagales bacterium]HAP60395.1 hypothetical protein [Cytophagales bacterium]
MQSLKTSFFTNRRAILLGVILAGNLSFGWLPKLPENPIGPINGSISGSFSQRVALPYHRKVRIRVGADYTLLNDRGATASAHNSPTVTHMTSTPTPVSLADSQKLYLAF